MMVFKKNAMNLNAAEDLREVACIYGELSSITEISHLLEKVDMDKLLSLVVGVSNTSKSVDELRGDFHKRLKHFNRRKQ